MFSTAILTSAVSVASCPKSLAENKSNNNQQPNAMGTCAGSKMVISRSCASSQSLPHHQLFMDQPETSMTIIIIFVIGGPALCCPTWLRMLLP
jgi:hypothetical protein